MTSKQIEDAQQESLKAFLSDLPALWTERPGQWVAYRADKIVTFAENKYEAYQKCFEMGLSRDEFVAFCIEPYDTEIVISGMFDE